MQEKLIEYSTAKLADKLGFKAEIDYYDPFFYITKTLKSKQVKEGDLEQVILDQTCCDTEYINPKYRLYVATKYELQKWLRETHKLNVFVHIDSIFKENTYMFEIEDLENPSRDIIGQMSEVYRGFTNYEAALELGLRVALELIKK